MERTTAGCPASWATPPWPWGLPGGQQTFCAKGWHTRARFKPEEPIFQPQEWPGTSMEAHSAGKPPVGGTHETTGEIWGQRPHAAVTPLVAAPAERLSHQEKIRGKFPSVLMNE